MTLAQRVMVMTAALPNRLARQLKCTKSPPAVCGEFYRQSGDESAGRACEYEGTHFELDGGIALPLNGGYLSMLDVK